MRGGRKLNYFNLHRFEYSQKPGLSRSLKNRHLASAFTIFPEQLIQAILFYTILIPKIA